MIKSKLIDFVRSQNLFGESTAGANKRLHPKEVESHIEFAINTLIGIAYQKGIVLNDMSILDNFTKAYRGTALFSNERNEYYIKLPISVIPLTNNSGIRSVCYTKDQSCVFDYIGNNSLRTYKASMASKMPNQHVFYIEDNVLWFPINNLKDTDLLLKLIPPFSAYDYDEEVYIPIASNNDMLSIIRQQIQGTSEKIYDNKNDNNSNVESR